MNDSKVGGKYRWSLIIVMALVWVFIYLQRTNISMLLVDYRFLAEVNLLNQPAQQGLLVTMFLLAYAVANMLSIPISSRLGPRRTLMFGIAVGSFVLMLGGWAASFAAILLARILTGVAHGIQYPNLSVLVKNWFPPEERGTANAIYAMGGCIGPALAMPLFAWLITWFGWEYSFFVPAALGILCTIPFLLRWISDGPEDNPYISSAEAAYIESRDKESLTDTPPGKQSGAVREVLQNPSFRLLCIVYAAFVCSWWGLLTWIPQYLVQVRHFEMTGMTGYVTIAYVAAMVSVFVGGRLVDRARYKGKVGLLALLIVALATFGIATVPSPLGAVICMVLAVSINEFVFPAVWAILQSILPSRLIVAGSGVVNGAGNLFSAATPTIMGVLIQFSGTYTGGLLFLVFMSVLGALCCWGLLRQGN